jgi:multiple sugar transport system ATP-binding protein
VSVRFRIKHTEYLGAERILYGVVEGGGFQSREAVVARLSAVHSGDYAPGSLQDFGVREQDLKFFERVTGQRTAPRPLVGR